jgi:hypothetical protein
VLLTYASEERTRLHGTVRLGLGFIPQKFECRTVRKFSGV